MKQICSSAAIVTLSEALLRVVLEGADKRCVLFFNAVEKACDELIKSNALLKMKPVALNLFALFTRFHMSMSCSHNKRAISPLNHFRTKVVKLISQRAKMTE